MSDATAFLLMSYGPRAAVRVRPSGAPWPMAWVWSPPPAKFPTAPAPPASPEPAKPATPVGTPVGYPRALVDVCLARMRSANAFNVADAILRAEPFASARPIGAIVRGGVAYTGAIDPWDMMWLPGRFADRPAERGAYAIEVARHYAAAIANGAARPRDMAPSFFDSATEPVPTLARTTAWVNAWARWSLDAAQIALDTPETYEQVAGALLRICRSWEPTVVP